MIEEEVPRLLAKGIDQVTATLDNAAGTFVIDNNGSDWRATYVNIAPGVHTGILRWEGYLDLSGYSLDDLTFFPGMPMAQEGGMFGMTLGGNFMVDYTIVSLVPITETMMMTIDPVAVATEFTVPGFMGSTTDASQIVWGQGRQLAPVSTANGVLSVQNAWHWGTGSPTASDKLYIHKFVQAFVEGDDSEIQIPPTNIMVPGIVGKEADLVYINRLRRSYEAQV